MKRTIKMSKKTLVETISNAVIKKLVTEGRLSNKEINQAIDDDDLDDYYDPDDDRYDGDFDSDSDHDYYEKKLLIYANNNPKQKGIIKKAKDYLYSALNNSYNATYQKFMDEWDDSSYDYRGNGYDAAVANIQDDALKEMEVPHLANVFARYFPSEIVNAIEQLCYDDFFGDAR